MSTPTPGTSSSSRPQAFSLVQGGLLYRVLCLAHLSDAELQHVRLRVTAIALLAWLPLLALSALGGRMLGGGVHVPFLLDVEAHTRFLLALPLLLVAEVEAHRRLTPIIDRFLRRHVIPEGSVPALEAAVASARRLRDSLLPEAVLAVLVYGVGIGVVWRNFLALGSATWYATPSPEGSTLTLAGWWYGCISLPIVQFLLLRWFWRLLVWAHLLWRISRIKLSLLPAHPDRCGGLGFLARSGHAFAVLAAALGAVAVGPLASRILYAGAKLPEFVDEIVVVIVFVLLALLGPLLFFVPQLTAARLVGLEQYGALAERYVREFDDKWLDGGAPTGEALVGSADIQSLADLGNAHEIVRTMRMAPLSRQVVIRLAVATLVPLAPLLFTVFSLNDLVKKLFGVFF